MIAPAERRRRKSLGKRLKKLREAKGVMQSHIAQIIGIDCPTLWRMERGEAGHWTPEMEEKWEEAVA